MSIPRITQLLSNRAVIHSIAITIANAAAAQTDTITIDGVACAYTSDATPTKQEVSDGLIAAIAAASVAGMFEVSQGAAPGYDIALRPVGPFLSPSISVSANLTDTTSWDLSKLDNDLATIKTDIALIKAGIPVSLSAEIPAGTKNIGEVSSNTILVSITPVITAGAYHANDIVGGTGAGSGLGINTLANAVRVSGGTGIIQSLVISDLAAQNAVFEIYLFSANPAAGTYTDNGALDIHDTDALLCIGRVDVAASDYKSLADNSIACVRSIGLPIKVAATSLFVIIRTTGTPTYAGTSDLKLTFGILRD